MATFTIKYTQGSGPSSITFRHCDSKTEALNKFWSTVTIKNNDKTKIVEVKESPN